MNRSGCWSESVLQATVPTYQDESNRSGAITLLMISQVLAVIEKNIFVNFSYEVWIRFLLNWERMWLSKSRWLFFRASSILPFCFLMELAPLFDRTVF